MWYAIISDDIENSLPLRKEHRPAHLEQLNLSTPGEAGFSGSLVVADFSSLLEAQAWAEQDPFLLNGVYQSVDVKPFIKVLPES